MKTLLKILALFLCISAFVACSDDDDNTPIIINDVMIVYNSDTGMISAIDLNNGALTPLGTFMYNGQVLQGLRDMVYNASNNTIYASSRSNYNDGALFSIDPSTLEATILNANNNDDWYALPGIEIYNGKIMATVYWDNYNIDYSTGLVMFELDGTMGQTIELMHNGEGEYFSDGMALEFGSSNNEIYVTDDEDIFIADTNGNISQILDMTAVGMPDPNDDYTDGLRTLETGNNGILYGIDRDSEFGSINLQTGVFTHIATLNPEDDTHVALTLIPENIFN